MMIDSDIGPMACRSRHDGEVDKVVVPYHRSRAESHIVKRQSRIAWKYPIGRSSRQGRGLPQH
jgi:hypothetical protein